MKIIMERKDLGQPVQNWIIAHYLQPQYKELTLEISEAITSIISFIIAAAETLDLTNPIAFTKSTLLT